ncbi:uncharacterized protein AMSG_12348 [Thecamonas trahens ATCC 50062]|uniref:Tyrosine-protein kinase ephrin type A/B receptor-like domain-containing protein n=1 Tax=Thecamonas trahens ATCC 50062 TaxID=461836 RepID=A0A0L0DST3_THETB|nr:hypothetical protein AMSG_12348 [Thecamonas trahens ATCC 50062]KNC54518.1 hypothetical protein AMSG_12348 [Thecamonas trahens ATCC 50062]|eukprot:XP_013753591.1 hypothetical protein AMSG_12348 [Thecamonas trahens ATCC 50062]
MAKYIRRGILLALVALVAAWQAVVGVDVPCDKLLQPSAQVISGLIDGAAGVAVVDCDKDVPPPPGPLSAGIDFNDVVVAGYESGTIEWVRNTGVGIGWVKTASAKLADMHRARFVHVMATSTLSGVPSVVACNGYRGSSAADFPHWCAHYVGDNNGNFVETIFATNLRRVVHVDYADVSGDGLDDVVTLEGPSFNPMGITFQLAAFVDDGAGSYNTTKHELADSVTVAALDRATTFALGDVTGDGMADIVFATHGGGDAVAYLPWMAATTYGPPVALLSADVGASLAVATGDFDGDGDNDVVHCTAASRLRWFENNAGDGSGWTTRSFPFQLSVSGVYAHDVDGDGDLDLVLASQNVNNLFWVANRYDGGGAGRGKDEVWGMSRLIAPCSACSGVAMGDLDADGDDDIVAAAMLSDTVSGFLVDPLDVLQYSFLAGGLGSPRMLRPLDADGDGDVDIIGAIGSPNNGVFVFGNSDGLGGAWASPARVGGELAEPETAIAVDLDLDGDTDVIASSAAGSMLVYAINDGGSFSSLEWSGQLSTSTAATAMAVVDVENDGDMDVVGIDAPNAVFLVKNLLLETEALGFGPATTVYANTGSSLAYLLVRDLNGDGYGDVVFSDTGTSSIMWLANNMNGYSAPALSLRTGAQQVGEFALGDLTGDGLLDLVFHTRGPPNPFGGKYSLSRSNNFGSATSPLFLTPLPVDPQVSTFVATDQTNVGIEIADIDGDNVLDIVVEGSFASVIIYFPGPSYSPRPMSVANADTDLRFVLRDFNLDGAPDFLIGLESQIGWIPGMSIFSPAIPLPGVTRTVAVARCGFTLSCVAETLLEASGCATTTVVMPTGVYRGCFSTRLLPLFKSVTIRGMGSTIDCGANGGGGLFDIRDGAEVSLQDMTIIGATSIPSDAEAVAALRVTGSGSSLTLTDVTLRGCSNKLASDRTVFQINAGMGGAVLVELGASITALRTAFELNVAGDSGGGLAVIGSTSSVNLTDVIFDGNTATGSGGGLLVLGSGSGSVAVSLSGVTLTNNVASGWSESYGSGSGGGALLLSESATVVLDVDWSGVSSTISGNSASGVGGGLAVVGLAVDATIDAPLVLSGNIGGWGGAIGAVVSVEALSSPMSSTGLAPAPPASDTAGSVALNGVVTMSDNRASYGGAMGLCGVRVRFDSAGSSSVAGSSASRGGGGVFVCLPAGTLPLVDADNTPEARSVDDVPWLSLGGGMAASTLLSGSSASGYGAVAASPPVTMVWSRRRARSVGPLDRATGASLGDDATVSLGDVFGQAVVDASVRISMHSQPNTPGGVVLAGGDRSRLMDAAEVSFATVKALAADSNALDSLSETQYSLEVSVVGVPEVAKVALSLQIRPCGLGMGLISLSGLPLECSECSEGTFSDEISLKGCMACPIGAFNLNKGATSCESCPDNAFRRAESKNVTAAGRSVPCVCKIGYYALNGATNVACQACPVGGVCAGGTNGPVAMPGFYPVGDGQFEECRLRDVCRGGDPPQCAAGHEGALCGVCARGYHTDKRGVCAKCPSGAPVVLSAVIVVVGIAAAAAGVFIVTRIQAVRDDDYEGRSRLAQRMTSIPRAVTMAFLFFQVLGVLGSAAMSWPEAAQSTLGVFDCTLTSFYAKYAVVMILPMVFVALFGLVCWGMLWSAHASFEMQEAAQSLAALVSPLMYLPLSRATLSIFDCTRLYDGRWLLDADMSLVCYNGTWWAVASFGGVCTMVYVVGIPAVCGWMLWKAKTADALFDARVLNEIGGLYRSYRRHYFWFELVQLGRRLWIACASLFFSTLYSFQFLLLGGVFFASTLAFLRLEPYFLPMYNTLEARLNAILVGILVLGIMFHGEMFSAPQQVFFTVVVILLIVAAIALLGAAFVQELRLLAALRKEEKDGESAVQLRSIREREFWERVHRELGDFEDQRLAQALRAHDPAGGNTSGVEKMVVRSEQTATEPEGDDWELYMAEPIGLRPSPELSILEWATMGMWRKKPFSLLQGLAARLPDVAVTAWMRDDDGMYQCALAVVMGHGAEPMMQYSAMKPSKNQAKQSAARSIMDELAMYDWLTRVHATTMCDEFLVRNYE